jgi:orotidine-5'-phosphate decarboxylase
MLPRRLASSGAMRGHDGAFVIALVAEMRPIRASSRMPRLTPSVRPKSSAQSTTRCIAEARTGSLEGASAAALEQRGELGSLCAGRKG